MGEYRYLGEKRLVSAKAGLNLSSEQIRDAKKSLFLMESMPLAMSPDVASSDSEPDFTRGGKRSKPRGFGGRK